MTSFRAFCLSQSIRLSSLCFLNCFKPTISWLTDAYFLLRFGITVFFVIFFFFLSFHFLVPTSLSCIALFIFSLHTFFLPFFLLAHLRRLNLISFLWYSKAFSFTKYGRLWSRSYWTIFILVLFNLLLFSTWSWFLLLCFVLIFLELVYFLDKLLIWSFAIFLSRLRRTSSSIVSCRKCWIRYLIH